MKIEAFFKKNRSKMDIYDLKLGHEARFLNKMEQKHKQRNLSKPFFNYKKYLVAASLLLLFGLGWQYVRFQKQKPVSHELLQNERYFTSIIQSEIEAIKAEETLETKKVFKDALRQIKLLEKDYQQLIKDYQINQDKYILNAMIQNFQQRIDILQYVKKEIKQIKDSKTHQNEKHRA